MLLQQTETLTTKFSFYVPDIAMPIKRGAITLPVLRVRIGAV